MCIMKILIVDDNKDITDLISKYLNLNDHECHVANDGRNGLNLIESQNHDVVLLDVSMPEFSGIDIVNTIAKKDKSALRKIILFTASSVASSEIDKLLGLGVHSCLKKPMDPDELISYLKTFEEKNIALQQ